MICGTALQTLLLLFVLYKTNWNKEVGNASAVMNLSIALDFIDFDFELQENQEQDAAWCRMFCA